MEYNAPPGSLDPNAPYVNGIPGVQKGSPVNANAVEYPQREILNVIQAAGITPTNSELDQLLRAIQFLAPSIVYATDAETKAGTITSKAVQPAALKSAYGVTQGGSGTAYWLNIPLVSGATLGIRFGVWNATAGQSSTFQTFAAAMPNSTYAVTIACGIPGPSTQNINAGTYSKTGFYVENYYTGILAGTYIAIGL